MLVFGLFPVTVYPMKIEVIIGKLKTIIGLEVEVIIVAINVKISKNYSNLTLP